jgi:hypothetical protein
MATYQLRLYKRRQSGMKNLHDLVQQIDIEADTEAEAIEKARAAQIPNFDDSDYAMLFSADGHTLWRLDA